MSVIGHFVELAGIATSGISLIREHSVGFRPPRALWVPFPLGRPFGTPNLPSFQTEVLQSLLSLFDSDAGPSVLSEFPKEAPEAPGSSVLGRFGPAARTAPKSSGTDLVSDAKAEVAFLAPHHANWAAQPGNRSITGASGLKPAGIIDYLGGLAEGADPTLPPNAAALSAAATIRLSGEEIRHWCIEAAMDWPAQNLSINDIDEWFWGQTACAALLLQTQAILAKSSQKDVVKVATAALIPRSQHHRLLVRE